MDIKLNNLTTGYRLKRSDKIISSSLNAELQRGQLTCLLGPNGAGKSTLLRTLTAFQPALSGQVLVEGRQLESYTVQERARIFSVVLTDNFRITGMTAYDVVGMGRSPYTGFWGKLSADDRRIVAESLELVGMSALAQRQIQTLSDGERQKVMIAKAIAQQTPFIFLDEPTAFLDYPSKVKMILLLQKLTRTLAKTIFLSTHDVEHALALADQIWLLDNQHGLTTGTTDQLSQNGAIGRYFDTDEMRFDAQTQLFHIAKV